MAEFETRPLEEALDFERKRNANFTLIRLRHKETGETLYTFEHWAGQDYYMTVPERPSHKTQVLTNYEKDLLEVVCTEKYEGV